MKRSRDLQCELSIVEEAEVQCELSHGEVTEVPSLTQHLHGTDQCTGKNICSKHCEFVNSLQCRYTFIVQLKKMKLQVVHRLYMFPCSLCILKILIRGKQHKTERACELLELLHRQLDGSELLLIV